MYLYVSNEHVVMYAPSTQQHTHMLLQIDFFKIDNNVVVMLWCLMISLSITYYRQLGLEHCCTGPSSAHPAYIATVNMCSCSVVLDFVSPPSSFCIPATEISSAFISRCLFLLFLLCCLFVQIFIKSCALLFVEARPGVCRKSVKPS